MKRLQIDLEPILRGAVDEGPFRRLSQLASIGTELGRFASDPAIVVDVFATMPEEKVSTLVAVLDALAIAWKEVPVERPPTPPV